MLLFSQVKKAPPVEFVVITELPKQSLVEWEVSAYKDLFCKNNESLIITDLNGYFLMIQLYIPIFKISNIFYILENIFSKIRF